MIKKICFTSILLVISKLHSDYGARLDDVVIAAPPFSYINFFFMLDDTRIPMLISKIGFPASIYCRSLKVIGLNLKKKKERNS